MAFSFDFPLAYRCGGAHLAGFFRDQTDDFFVEEKLGFPLAGEGEHLCLYIEKQRHNTHWLAAELARYVGIREADIGFCGRKDRHAVTRQWFSVYDPNRSAVDWGALAIEGVTILKCERHKKKLRLGMHKENCFTIRLREVTSHSLADSPITKHSTTLLSESVKQQVLENITTIFGQGVPNYFGSQRFGRQGSNLLMANDWLLQNKPPPRKQRSMVLSAARSYLFNRVLAVRVREKTWNTLLCGEVLSSDQLPTGPLWGRGRLATSDDVLRLEQRALEDYVQWCERLEHQGLQQERRCLVLKPRASSATWQRNDLILSFTLPVGAFATAVLAEFMQLKERAASASVR